MLMRSVFKSRPCKAWNGAFVSAGHITRSLGVTQLRVHMTESPTVSPGKVIPLSILQSWKAKNMAEKQIRVVDDARFPLDDALFKLQDRISEPEQRVSLPVKESGKWKAPSLITIPLEEKLLNKRSLEGHSSQVVDKLLELNRLREAHPKVSHVQGNLAEFWNSLSYPLQPRYFLDDDLKNERTRFVSKLDSLLKSTRPEYPDDVKEVASGLPLPEEGKFFDVVELLSRFPGDLIRNDEDRSRVSLCPDTFKGKYVLICCVNVPVLPRYYSSYFPFFVNLCNELCSTRDDLEIVLVARMNNLASDEEVFHHFLSGFPKSCLAVPFEDSQRTDYICKVIGDGQYDIPTYLLLNGEGLVEGMVLGPQGNQTVYETFGAEDFPFTGNIWNKRMMEMRDIIFEKEGNWLERVLRCGDSSPDFVYRFNPSGGPREEMPISEFSKSRKNKHVGIYLCTSGSFIQGLENMRRECREYANTALDDDSDDDSDDDFEFELDFEVVVVYMPFSDITDPKVLEGEVERLLKEHNVCDWWCLPFNNSVSLRFNHLTRFYEIPSSPSNRADDCDKVVMVGPGVNHLDIYGRAVMWYQGFSAFPFTVDAGIKLVVDELKEFTLESLFHDDEVSISRGNDSSDCTELGQLLKGKKNIILCIGRTYEYTDFKALASIYNETKAVEKEGFEMVFVALGTESRCKEFPYEEMPWYICPINGIDYENLTELLECISSGGDILFGFGEDGEVGFCSEIKKVISDAKCYESKAEYQRFSLVNSLYRDIEHYLGYDEFYDHAMSIFLPDAESEI